MPSPVVAFEQLLVFLSEPLLCSHGFPNMSLKSISIDRGHPCNKLELPKKFSWIRVLRNSLKLFEISIVASITLAHELRPCLNRIGSVWLNYSNCCINTGPHASNPIWICYPEPARTKRMRFYSDPILCKRDLRSKNTLL